jgi:hypothetical protein
MKKVFTIFIVFVACVVTTQPASAGNKDKTDKKPWYKFQVNLGGFLAAMDSSIRVGTSSVALDVDVEEFLDLDTSGTTFRLGGLYRI